MFNQRIPFKLAPWHIIQNVQNITCLTIAHSLRTYTYQFIFIVDKYLFFKLTFEVVKCSNVLTSSMNCLELVLFSGKLGNI